MSTSPNQDEAIGRIYRAKKVNRQRLAFVDAELAGISVLFKKASSQMDCLLAHERNELKPVLSQLDINHTLQLVAEREQLLSQINVANEQLKKLGVPL